MNTNEVIDIINAVCDKLGLVCNSVADFMPYLAKAMIVKYAFWAIVGLAFAILSNIWLRWCIKTVRHLRNEKLYDWEERPGLCMAHVASVIMLLVGLLMFLCNLASAMCWIISPEAATVDYILSFLS